MMTEKEFLYALYRMVEANQKTGVLIENYIKEHQIELDEETKKLLNQCTNEALAKD